MLPAKRVLTLLLVAFVAATVLGLPRAGRAAQPESTVLFSIPLGSDGIGISVGRPEEMSWGPAAMTIDADGAVWIADTVGRRVLAYTKTGALLGVIDLADRAIGIGDLAVDTDRVAILDIASPSAAVLLVDRSTGATLNRLTVPASAGLASGLSGVGEADGEFFLEYYGGTQTAPLASGKVDGNAIAEGRPSSRGRFVVEARSNPSKLRSTAWLRYGEETITIGVDHYLAGLALVGEQPSTFDVSVDELTQTVDGTVRVDSTVRRFTVDGRQVGTGRIPIADRSTYVANGIASDRVGDVLALVPRTDRVDVVRISIMLSVAPILPTEEFIAPEDDVTVLSCRDRRAMDSVRAGYTSNSKYLSNTNINGTCAGRVKPHYLGSAGTYPGVSYDWGGWDTSSGWNTYMTDGKQAGDLPNTVESCSKGVDCSGFVQRIWGLSDKKYNVTMLADSSISHAVPIGSLIAYDAYAYPGFHIVIWHRWEGSGLMVSEATTSDYLDRTVYRYVGMSYINGYVIRRYNNVC